MDRNFKRALPFVLKHEGGWADNPKDPGGATMKGVTLATFRRYVKANATKQDLRNITDEQIATVYYRHFWSAVNAPSLPAGLDYAVFDFAVNSGPSRAAVFLQRIVGVKQDGRIGPATIAAVNERNAADLITKLCSDRLAWLKTTRHKKTKQLLWPTFGGGWTRRVADVEKVARSMVGQPADVEHVAVPVPMVPKDVDKAVKKQTQGWGWSGVGVGGLGTAITAVAGWPWQTIALFAGIAVAGGVVALIIGPLVVRRVKAIRQEIAA